MTQDGDLEANIEKASAQKNESVEYCRIFASIRSG